SRVDKSCTACVRSSTVSYVTVRPPLFTRRPLRPSVDGASDPTEGRRLDRESHRWCEFVSDCWGRSDLRVWLRRGGVGAATPDHGGPCFPGCPAVVADRTGVDSHRTDGSTQAAPGSPHRHDLCPRHTGTNPGRRAAACTTGGATYVTADGAGASGTRDRQWLQLRLLHLVGGAQALHPVAGECLPVVVERAGVRLRRRSHAAGRRRHGDGDQRHVAAGSCGLCRVGQRQRLLRGVGDELVGRAGRWLEPRRLPDGDLDARSSGLHLLIRQVAFSGRRLARIFSISASWATRWSWICNAVWSTASASSKVASARLSLAAARTFWPTMMMLSRT